MLIMTILITCNYFLCFELWVETNYKLICEVLLEILGCEKCAECKII